MSELEKLQAELKAADDKVKAAVAERGAALDQLAALCPVKIGDVVECNGYSYEGKGMVVSHVFYKPSSLRKSLWVCSGAVLKNDGFPGKNLGEHYV